MLENDPEKSFRVLKKLEKDSSSYTKQQKKELFLGFSGYYKKINDLQQTDFYLKRCLALGLPEKTRCEIYYKLGANAYHRGEYHEVIDWMTHIFKLRKYSGLSTLAKAETLTGLTYSVIGDYGPAEKHLLNSVKTFSSMGDSLGLSQSYGNLGELKRKSEHPATALFYFKRALLLTPEAELYAREIALSNVGGIYVEIKEYDSAQAYIFKALNLSRELGDELGELICVNNLATIYRDRNRFGEALGYYLKALEMEDRVGSKEEKKTILLNLSEIYEKLGRSDLSYNYFKQYTALKDELFNAEKSEFIVETQEKYEASERKKEIAELKIIKQRSETEKLNMRYGMLIGIILFTGAGILSLAIYRIRSLRARNAARLALISASLDAEERERLRISQELHDDLGGILGMSRMLFSNTKKILKTQDEELYNRIDQLLVMANDRSRAISHELFSPALKAFGLIAAVEEQLGHIRRIHPGLEATLEANEHLRLDPQLELNLFRVSQELLNNTLKYARATQIRMSIHNTGGFVHYLYSDNGAGFDSSKIKKGVGLNSIESRVQRFNGLFVIKSAQNKGFTVEIKIPV